MRVRGVVSGVQSGDVIMHPRPDSLPWHCRGWIWCVSASEMSVQGSEMARTGSQRAHDQCVIRAMTDQLKMKKYDAKTDPFSS